MKPTVEQLETRDLPARHLIVLDLPERMTVANRAVIMTTLRRIVGPLGTQVIQGDAETWAARGRRRPDLLVSAVLVGGRSPGDEWFGIADRVAPRGFNDEGVSRVFSGTMQAYGWRGVALAQEIAFVAAHEVGHMLGLRHTQPSRPGSIMNAVGGGDRLLPRDAAEWIASRDQPTAR